MADEADHAQVYEERERAAAIAAALHGKQEERLVVKGVQVCLCCGEELTRARLQAYPRAVRCVPCQEDKEAGL